MFFAVVLNRNGPVTSLLRMMTMINHSSEVLIFDTPPHSADEDINLHTAVRTSNITYKILGRAGHLGDLRLRARAVLERIPEKYCVKTWAGFNWLRVGRTSDLRSEVPVLKLGRENHYNWLMIFLFLQVYPGKCQGRPSNWAITAFQCIIHYPPNIRHYRHVACHN
jgi:hypothetical protein